MLVQLEARSFRNLGPLSWSGLEGANLILGSNGAGKTSLLEAIYVLATTRSFRTPQLTDCKRRGADRFELACEVDRGSRSRLEVAWRGGKTHRSLNGSKSTLAQHLSPLPIICWTADSVEILTGAPSQRRRFLDRGLVGIRPASIGILSSYRQTLNEKRKLLQGAVGPLEPWNRLLAEAASELCRLRAAYVGSLSTALAQVLDECDLGLPAVSLGYIPSPSCALEGAEAIEAELARCRQKEEVMGRPLVGPHRDELEISWSVGKFRRMASAGERKALGLALLASQGRLLAEKGRPPLYLLDDADTELDPLRLASIWRAFGPARQLIATSNRAEAWRQLGFDHYWSCSRGQLRSTASWTGS